MRLGHDCGSDRETAPCDAPHRSEVARMAGVCSALNKTMATTTMGIAVMRLERQVIAACGSAVCGDDLAMEVPASWSGGGAGRGECGRHIEPKA